MRPRIVLIAFALMLRYFPQALLESNSERDEALLAVDEKKRMLADVKAMQLAENSQWEIEKKYVVAAKAELEKEVCIKFDFPFVVLQ